MCTVIASRLAILTWIVLERPLRYRSKLVDTTCISKEIMKYSDGILGVVKVVEEVACHKRSTVFSFNNKATFSSNKVSFSSKATFSNSNKATFSDRAAETSVVW